MTTILFDRQERTLYVDSRATTSISFGMFKREKSYVEITDDAFNKIFVNEHNRVVTGTGSVYAIYRYLETGNRKYLKATRKRSNSCVWIITKFPFKIVSVEHDGEFDVTVDEKRYIINGSGKYCASTGLRLCDNPLEVMNAIADPYTGGEIKVIKISDGYINEDQYC